MKRVAAAVAACLLLAASYSPEAAGRTWVQATSPHFVVLSDTGERTTKTVAWQLWERRNGVRPASIFATGYDRHFIALRTDEKVDDTVGINPYIVAYWSYVNLVVENAVRRDLPLWVSRGLANVLSNTIVHP